MRKKVFKTIEILKICIKTTKKNITNCLNDVIFTFLFSRKIKFLAKFPINLHRKGMERVILVDNHFF